MTVNSSSGFSADVSAYKGGKKVKKQSKPKALKGKLKQTEGYTPRSAMPAGKKAGKSARDKRLANLKM